MRTLSAIRNAISLLVLPDLNASISLDFVSLQVPGYREPGSSTSTSCALRLNVERERCDVHSVLETVQVHEKLHRDMLRQEKECGVPAQELNANAVGGVAGRNRRYFVPGTDLSKIERFRLVNAQVAVYSANGVPLGVYHDSLVSAFDARCIKIRKDSTA